ncbi:MAG: phosphatidylserine/phosphatidylglycerophosphate/cardiolipin synthase family protein [Candidatus Gracilibacteria bacterium]|nr:phosphatidylserine/phosphatidylglycerophosphate/cardiolipin synthase family protein [Candidatus Gracilibacteria bacterium]
MKKEKIISSIIIIIFFIIFSVFNFGEYYDFHKQKIENTKNYENNKNILKNFDIKNIKEIKNISLRHTPNKDLLDEIVKKIENSKEKIYIEVYMFTENRIKTALIKAKKRGIDVKVILEKDPYMAYSINDKTYNELKKNTIEVVWSNTKNYSLNHSKMIIIDDEIILSTGNLTYSTFTQNRDFFVFIKDKKILLDFLKIFDYDFNGIKNYVENENIVISPNNSRIKIEKLFENAKNEIKIYMQYLNDEEMNQKLLKLKEKDNLKIQIIIDETAINNETTKNLQNKGIEIKKLPKYKMHSKAILIDNETIFIGSVNFSNYSLDKNRELGILTNDKQIIIDFLDRFKTDFK